MKKWEREEGESVIEQIDVLGVFQLPNMVIQGLEQIEELIEGGLLDPGGEKSRRTILKSRNASGNGDVPGSSTAKPYETFDT